MTPGARLAAAIECLDLIGKGQAAEKVLTSWARRSRYAGSKDRAAIRDHVFDVLRTRQSCAMLGGGDTGRALTLGLCALQELDAPALFAGGRFDPEELGADERATWDTRAQRSAAATDAWNMSEDAQAALLRSHGAQAPALAQALRARAPVDLRVNLRKTNCVDAQAALANEGIETVHSDIYPTALRVTQGARKLRNSKCFADGLVELQDAGSQKLITDIVDHMRGRKLGRVLDYCAGGGGKTLALAALSDAKIYAHDIAQQRMKDIAPRAMRAGVQVTCVETDALARHGPFDLVLCDAPCSGSGAWRRTPDTKWTFTESRLAQMTQMQLDVLESAMPLVAKDGVLAFATCSLFAEENAQLVEAFVSKHPSFSQIHSSQTTPLNGTDGFFLSILVS